MKIFYKGKMYKEDYDYGYSGRHPVEIAFGIGRFIGRIVIIILGIILGQVIRGVLLGLGIPLPSLF